MVIQDSTTCSEEDEEANAIIKLAEQGGDESLMYLAYEDWLEIRT